MSQPPDETPDFLAKPVPPSGEQPTSPYVSPPDATQPGYQHQPPYQPPYQQGPYPPQPYGAYPPGLPGYPFAQAHSGASTAMGLGITSVVCAVLTFLCCLAAVGTLAGPFAIALAVRARKEMAQSPGLFNNESAATTGLVTGIIGTVIGLAGIALVVFVFGALFAVGSSGY